MPDYSGGAESVRLAKHWLRWRAWPRCNRPAPKRKGGPG